MEIEEVSSLDDLFDFVREHTLDENAVASFMRLLHLSLMPFRGRYMRIFTTRGMLDIPQAFRAPGVPAQLEGVEVIFNVGEFENPGFRFGLDAKGVIQYCIGRNPREPLDRFGAPPGSTIH
jgi:hypothetical protein